ncbi:MAG: amidase [Alphaproteobacteria bacterium]|nr:amidase [Alphaproteobacteria bacterium]
MVVRRPSTEELTAASQELGLSASDAEVSAYGVAIDRLLTAFDTVERMSDETPPVRCPRTPGYRPAGAENEFGAWAVKSMIRGSADGKLAGKSVVLKDTIAVAGLPMANGSDVLEGFVPAVDATIVSRILDAGGTIAGKAVCEYFSYSGASHTAATGPVHNPYKRGYSAGGSSSGCAALVARGEVDMAMGGDQAGSIRVPAAYCGIVGLKPTYGLVPYTGIMSSEFTVDHTGPMTRTVADNALLLEAVAGVDGIDPRQRDDEVRPYCDSLREGCRGLRIAVLEEGFGWPNSETDVDAKVRAAAAAFAELGARVESVSIPIHRDAKSIWASIALEGYYANMFLGGGFGTNHEGLFLPALNDRLRDWRRYAPSFPHSLKMRVLLGDYVSKHYGGRFYGKAMNLSRRLRAAYDAVLSRHDLLLMPTAPMKAQPMPPADAPIALQIERTSEQSTNTAPFNITHHPALTLPCGLSAGLPIGLMLVARAFEETALFRAAFAFEQVRDWRER